MWLLLTNSITALDKNQAVLFETVAAALDYIVNRGIKEFHCHWIAKYEKKETPEAEEKAERKICEELVPLSRAKES